MKINNKNLVLFALTISLFFSLFLEANAQGSNQLMQVKLEGQSIATRHIGNNPVTEGLWELFPGERENLANHDKTKVTVDNFTVFYTKNRMRIDSHQKIYHYRKDSVPNNSQPRGTPSDAVSGTVIFRFNQAGTNLNMLVKIQGEDHFNMTIPRGNGLTTSGNAIRILSSGSIAETISGYATQKHSYKTVDSLNIGTQQFSNLYRNDGKIFRTHEGSVWLAPDADGIDVIKSFYEKLIDGGYDLSGAENGGIMALMGELLSIGMIIKSKEIFIVSEENPHTNAQYNDWNEAAFIETFTNTIITNISMSLIDDINFTSDEESEEAPSSLEGASEFSINPQENPTSSSSTQTNPQEDLGSQSGSPINPQQSSTSSSSSQTNPQERQDPPPESESESKLKSIINVLSDLAPETKEQPNAISKSTASKKEQKPEGCDCSCEKYAEYMKMGAKSKRSKKNRKKIEMTNMQQIDMGCLKKCIPKWASNCIDMGN